jgi:flagellar motor protein MotB
MLAVSERSQLQTQMGQEVIYLLLTSSMLGCIVLAAYVLLNMDSSAELQKEVSRLRVALATTERKAGELAAQLATKEAKERAARVPAKGIDKPPIILLPEAEGYYFEIGSAEITATFAERIKKEIIPKIISEAQSHQANVIEIIGHTDGVAVGTNLRVKANLDFTIAGFMDGQQSEAPIPFDNAGLGIARAVAMAKALRAAGLADRFEILPLSAGSLILPSDRYSPGNLKENDQSRRRIEIRLRRRHA